MITDGFLTTDPEYKAALLYFSQEPAPTRVLIGRQVTTAPFTGNCAIATDSAVVTPASMTGIEVGQVVSGTGIAVGAVVKEMGATTITLDKVATATNAAASLTFTAVVETAVEALHACRAADYEWCTYLLCGATKDEVLSMAGEVEVMTPSTIQFFTTADADVLAGTAGNIFETLKGLKYNRTLGQYSTKHTDAVASALGYAMGANTGLADSAYTLALKDEPGVTVESITETQYKNITDNNGNVYVNRGDLYNMFEPGVMADGTFFDEVINLDKLVNDLQITGIDALKAVPRVAQTENGITYLLTRLKEPCETALKVGFVAPGKWTSKDVLRLKNGDYLSKGYMIMSESIDSQAIADREARKAPAIYVALKLAGAVHSAVIGVYVNR
jgi:hypothetical protein